MKTYKIKFTSGDGNINTVYIDAHSESEASWIFQSDYSYGEILSIEQDN
jgi:hypothetical protein